MTAEVRSADWRRNQAAVTVATFIGFTGFTLVMPFLPLYFEQLGLHDTGAIAIWSGVCLGVTPAITATLAPMWARVADRYGRKLMVARSLMGFVIVMAALAAVRHPWQVFVLRAVLGVFAGYGPIAMTMAAESSPPEQMATAIGWVQTAQRLGPALGPVIGGVLAQTLGLRETFLVAAVVYLGAFLLVVFGYRERAGGEGHTHAAPVEAVSFDALRRVPHFVLCLGTVFGLQLVDRSFGPVLPLFLREIGIPIARAPFLSGVIFTVSAAAAALGNQTTSWWLDRVAAARVVAVAAAVAGAAAIGFAVGPPISGLLVSAVVFGLGIGVATTAIYTVAGRAVSSRERGTAFGYLTTAYLVGLAVSPVVAGLMGSRSMRSVFMADAGGLALVAWIVRKRMTA
jgi:DHA1 family multidrug resistance protein-like MFS transporter